MKCPYCSEELTWVVRYFGRHQTIQIDAKGNVGEVGPVHDDGVEDIACGNCLHSPEESSVESIKDLVVKLCEI